MKVRAIAQLLFFSGIFFTLIIAFCCLDVQLSLLTREEVLPLQEPLFIRYLFRSICSLGAVSIFGPGIALFYAFALYRFIAIFKKKPLFILNGIAFCLFYTTVCVVVASTTQWTVVLLLFLKIPPYLAVVMFTHIFLAILFFKENALRSAES